jgi:hypothetical protein
MYLPAGLVPASQHPAGILRDGALPVQIIRSRYGVVKIAPQGAVASACKQSLPGSQWVVEPRGARAGLRRCCYGT